jgi:hypothetical protein
MNIYNLRKLPDEKLTPFLCSQASKKGSLKCLKYLYSRKCKWDERTCTNAVKNGHIKCLEFAHKNGCPWNKNTFDEACKNGNLVCVSYLYYNDCPRGKWIMKLATINGNLACMMFLEKMLCNLDKNISIYAAESGNIYCLKYAFEKSYSFNEKTHVAACKYGSLECLEYLNSISCPVSNLSFYELIIKNDLIALKYLLLTDHFISSQICSMAIHYDKYECFKLIIECGVYIDFDVYSRSLSNYKYSKFLSENESTKEDYSKFKKLKP